MIGLRPDVFEIDADAGFRGDGDQGKVGRVREVEPEPAAQFSAQLRLAERVIGEAYLARARSEVAPQKGTQDSSRGNKTPPVTRKSKTCAPIAFVIREGRVKAGGGFRRQVQRDAPTVDFVGRQSKSVRRAASRHPQLPTRSIVGEQSVTRTASAIATTTSRGPSKGSLPCAVRRLSTSSRSPACHPSRTVLASYASLIAWTTSAPIGSPLPKRVLNGSPSSP